MNINDFFVRYNISIMLIIPTYIVSNLSFRDIIVTLKLSLSSVATMTD